MENKITHYNKYKDYFNHSSVKSLELFFDSNEIGYITETSGEFKPFSEDLIFSSSDNDSILRCQNKMSPLKNLGEGYEDIYITYVPAKELDYYYSRTNNDYKVSSDIQIKPLIKVSKTQNSFSLLPYKKCYLSGRRSAIYIDNNGTPIRMKGCGNLFNGFNI